jgi:hypothetical protein
MCTFEVASLPFNLSFQIIFMLIGNKIREKIEVRNFIEKVRDYGHENIECSSHTFFRLSEKQRSIFTCDSIKQMLLNDIPILAGIQHNGCYTAFYKHKNKRFIKLILDIKADRIEVVTFYVIEEKQLPVIK